MRKQGANDLMFFDLSFDPQKYLILICKKYIQWYKNLVSLDLSKYGINKTIPICPSEMIEDTEIFDMDFSVLEERASW